MLPDWSGGLGVLQEHGVCFNSSIRRAAMAEDIQVKREIVLEADAEALQKMRKEGHARGFTVYCDEAERTGGENTAPPPLAYFGLSLAF
jgi:hypothetical protein